MKIGDVWEENEIKYKVVDVVEETKDNGSNFTKTISEKVEQ